MNVSVQKGARTRRPAAAAVLALPRGFFANFELFLEKVKKCPPPRIEPNFAPIFPRDVTNRPGPYSFGARDSFLGPGFDLSPKRYAFPGVGARLGGSFFWPGPVTDSGRPGWRPPLLSMSVRLEWEILGSKCVGSGN